MKPTPVTHTRLTLLLRFFVQVVFLAIAIFWGNSALAATLSLSPSTGVYAVGQTFTASVVVNTAGASINAAEGTLSFRPTELAVVSVSKGSVFNLWTSEPSFSNSAGTVSFSGGTPAGYRGGAGTVVSVTFRTLAAGSPRVSFSNGAVLAADGRGTNVLTGMNGGSYTVSAQTTSPAPETIIEYVAPANTPGAPSVSSVTHPDQTLWYQAKTAELSWTLPAGVTQVRTLLDDRATSVPTRVYETPISSITLNDLSEGVQYFHIQFRNADGWGRVTHYRLAVDSVAPSRFNLSLSEGADLSNPEQKLAVDIEDASSPVTTFKVQIDGGQPVDIRLNEEDNTLTLPKLEPGYHTVIVEAFDAAGNSVIDSLSFTILAFDKPEFTDVPTRINSGVIPVFEGVTRPNAEVIISLTLLGNEPQETSVTSDENGVFRFIPSSRLSEGVYELTARALDQYGAQSEVSQPARFIVEQPGFIKIGSFLVSVLSVIVPLIVLTGFMIFAALFMYRRLRTVRVGVAREAGEAIDILEREFAAVRSTLAAQADALKHGRKTNKLTKAESELVAELEHALEVARTKIVKEIADVEDIV